MKLFKWLFKRRPPKRWQRILGRLILALLITDILLTQYWRRIEIGHATTHVTGPLTADGVPDYVAALNAIDSAGVTSENNAAPLLLKVIGTNVDNSALEAFYCKQALPQIGLLGEPIPGMLVGFQRWSRAAGSVAEDVDESQMSKRPWIRQEHPSWSRWLDDQQSALVLVHQALERPRYYTPYVVAPVSPDGKLHQYLHGTLLPQPGRSHLRWLANVMLADAMRAVGEGDFTTFETRLEDSLRLAHMLAQRAELLYYLSGRGIESASQQVLQRVAAEGGSGGLSLPQARSLLKQIDELPSPPSVAPAISNDRLMLLNLICELAVDGGKNMLPDNSVHWLFKIAVPIHYNKLLRQSNAHYDRLVEASRLPTHQERKAAFKYINDDMENRLTTWSKITGPMTFLVNKMRLGQTRSFGHVAVLETESQVSRDLARVAMALRIYRLEHGEFPESLDALSPEILPTVPQDRFIDEPLKYRRVDNGYLLYSVGRDELDDGGKEQAPRGKTGDIVVRAER